jgi:hypothetical protein
LFRLPPAYHFIFGDYRSEYFRSWVKAGG